MADVFVSYSRQDKALVAPLVAAIEAEGWSVWWDPEIDPGQEFDRRIAAELEIAAAVLVIWTPQSVESRWVRGEARIGADRGVLVPVRFAGANLPIDVRVFHTTDFENGAENEDCPPRREMIRALKTTISRQQTSAVARAVPAASHLERADKAEPGARSFRAAICVLPFANMSGDPEQEYFSDGITEDVITDLSKVSALSVTSRNSSFTYKGRHVDVPKVARELKVSHVLEGSVRKAGGRVRITAQLIDGRDNNHIWAERYDRDMNDIFALQDEISQAIVAALKLKLLPAEKRAIEQRGTDKADAYNLYLMAWRHYVASHRSEEDPRAPEAMLRLCDRAIQIDPDYAQAWALKAIAQMILHFSHLRDVPDGLAAVERAISLNPGLAEAHAIRARILSRKNRQDDAAVEIAVALRLDPESFEVNRSAAYWHFRQQQLPQAIQFYEKAMQLMPEDTYAASMLLTCYYGVHDLAAARRVAETVLARVEKRLALDEGNWAELMRGADALATLGQGERAKEWMNRALLIEPEKYEMRYNFACTLASRLNETDAAIELIGPVLKRAELGFLNHMKVDPDLNSLRADQRFRDMMAAAEARLGI